LDGNYFAIFKNVAHSLELLCVSPGSKLRTTFLNLAKHYEIMSKDQFTGTATQPQCNHNFCQFNKDQFFELQLSTLVKMTLLTYCASHFLVQSIFGVTIFTSCPIKLKLTSNISTFLDEVCGKISFKSDNG